MQNSRLKFYFIILVIITFSSFTPALKNGLTNWDDNKYISENLLIREISFNGIKKIFSSFFCGNYHPLTLLSYSLEYKFTKDNPLTFHLTNIILHTLNTVLVFYFIYLLSKKSPVAFICALLFGIHPMRVESVAWVSERKDVLSTFFFFLSCISYIKYRENKSNLFFTYVILSFIFSLLSKAIAVVLPAVFLLIDYYIEGNIKKERIYEKILFFIISFIFGVVAIYAQKLSGSVSEESYFPLNIFIASYGILFYIYKLFLPVKLSCLYPYPSTIISKLPFIYLVSPVIVTGLGYYIFRKFTNNRVLIFGLLWFLIAVLPVLQILPVGKAVTADRYSYIPYTGFFYIIGEYFMTLYEKKKFKNIMIIVLILISITLSYLTTQRCKVWYNGLSLWNDFIKNNKTYPLAYHNRGNELRRLGKYEEALSDYNNALKYGPNFTEAYYNRGVAYYEMKDYNKALQDFNKAIEIQPKFFPAYFSLGNIYNETGDKDKAMFYYTEAIEINPQHAEAYYNRGLLFYSLKKYTEAIQDFTQAVRSNPYFLSAYLNRGMVYGITGDYEKAINDLNTVIKLNPKFTGAYNNRGNAYFMMKNYEKAIKDYTTAINLSGGTVDLYLNRGVTYLSTGDYISAIDDFTSAIKIDSKCFKAYLNRIQAYIKLKKYDMAISDYKFLKNNGYSDKNLEKQLGIK